MIAQRTEGSEFEVEVGTTHAGKLHIQQSPVLTSFNTPFVFTPTINIGSKHFYLSTQYARGRTDLFAYRLVCTGRVVALPLPFCALTTAQA